MYIYLHLPFCNSICSYCDFPKVLYEKKYIEKYLNALKEEIETRYKNEKVKTIYIGGGTPTCLSCKELEQLLTLTTIFNKEENIEFTIETNVESLNDSKIKLLKKYGINRISIGVQTFRENVLKELNRHHTNQMVREIIKKLKKQNLTNISIDYIYGVNEDINAIEKDMQEFLSLDIPHISCYSLIIEEGTILKIKGKENINDQIDSAMYHKIESILEKNNYHHYEISNYAKEGYQSIHNLNYWNNGQYLGFGLGAVTFYNNIRRTNTRNLSKYLNKEWIQKEEKEDINIQISNELIVGLRKIEGISIKNFYQKYKKDLLKQYNIEQLLQEGLLELDNNNLKIPKKYIYTSNEILINFI